MSVLGAALGSFAAAAVVAVVSTAPVAGGAAAQPPSSGPTIVPGSRSHAPGPTHFGDPLAVATGDDGTVAVVFTHLPRSPGTDSPDTAQDAFDRRTVLVAVRRPDGSWERARTVSDPLEGASRPQAVVDRHGAVLVAWLHLACADRPIPTPCSIKPSKVLARTRSPHGRWGPIVTLARNAFPEIENPDPPAVAVGADGAATVAFKGGRPRQGSGARTNPVVVGTYAVYRRSAAAGFGPAREVPGVQDTIVSAIGRGGRAYVAGIAGQREDNTAYIAVSVRGAASPWSRARRASGRPASNPSIAVAGDGAVVVAWHEAGRETGIDLGYGPARAAIGTPAGRFAPAQRLGEEPVYAVRVAAGPEGETIVSWAGAAGGAGEPERGLSYAVRPDGGAFGPSQTIVPAGQGREVGDGTVGFVRGGTAFWFSERRGLRLATRPAAGAFATPRIIATDRTYYEASAVASSIAAVAGQDGRVLRIVTVRPP